MSEHEISFNQPLPEIAALPDLLAIAKLCPACGALAVIPLTRRQLAVQPDATTHACHPFLGGCNLGYAAPTVAKAEGQ